MGINPNNDYNYRDEIELYHVISKMNTWCHSTPEQRTSIKQSYKWPYVIRFNDTVFIYFLFKRFSPTNNMRVEATTGTRTMCVDLFWRGLWQ